MSLTEIVAILALTAWSVYKQTRMAEVKSQGRFKLAIIYTAVGLGVGGFDLPSGLAGAAMIVVGLALSLIVGVIRGRLTRIWVEPDGRIFRRGTGITVALFLGLVAVKFALGAYASVVGIDDGAGFGEVLIMIAIMIAVQAELVWRRAQTMRAAIANTDISV